MKPSSLSVEALRSGDFRLLLFTRMFAAMALQAQAVIVGWQIYSLTNSTLMLGFAGLTEAIPALCGALVSGHIVDVNRPHRIMLVSIGILVVNMLTLLLVAGGVVYAGKAVVPCIFAGIFVSGVARCFIMPSAFALLSQIIPRSGISSASAYLSSSFQIASVSGPAIAGLLYGYLGARCAWLMPVSLMLCSFLMLMNMSARVRNYKSEHVREPAMKSIRAGWHFILHNQVLLSVMALDMFAVLFGGAVAMLPAYADKVLHVGSEGLGALRAAGALGSVFMALWLAVKPLQTIRATTLLWVVTGFGLCIIGFGLSTIFWLSFLFLAASGACDSVSVVIRTTLMQLLTPDAMRGRVSAVNSMFIISSNEIGAFESGLAAFLLGLVPSVVFGGLCTLAIAGVTALVSPKFRRAAVTAEGVIS